MKLRDYTKQDFITLGKQVNRNPEHLYKIAIGQRPCPAKLAIAIERATNGLIKKGDLFEWD